MVRPARIPAATRPPRGTPVVRALTLLLAGLVGIGGLAGCESRAPYLVADCERADLGERSIARVWDETLLALIRQVVPAPGVHARNLFHVSAAMWDAWAAYDPTARGWLVTEKRRSGDVTAAREAAMSFAAYRILLWRYATVADLTVATEQLDTVMGSLCYRTDYAATDGDDPAALGNRIAAAVIEFGKHDGSLEDQRYRDLTYVPVNDPLEVKEPGTTMVDPNRWQPLSLDKQIAQNGLPVPGKVQEFIGPHWGHVVPFALPRTDDGVPIDPGSQPRLGDPATGEELVAEVVDVIAKSAAIDAADGVTIDISPAALGDNPLGTNDGDGHEVNAVTGEPYAENVVLRGDFARVLAEFWADGPKSETPPGHWNVIANEVGDALGDELRIGGDGEVVDRLEWDVKLYFALNGAVHDAAIAAWGLKGHYDAVRPISLVRYMGGKGQATDPALPSYDPDGLPLVPGLIELASEANLPVDADAAWLEEHRGEVVVRAWNAYPEDPETQTAGVGWVRAVEWVPYQRPTFVTPAFAGFVSGHSTFSRAAAEVMTAFTGSEWFPGGLSSWTVKAGSLIHEDGPTRDVTLQLATYFDAADQAGISRLYGGIHIRADDLEGRRAGSQCGKDAWALARTYYDGTAGG